MRSAPMFIQVCVLALAASPAAEARTRDCECAEDQPSKPWNLHPSARLGFGLAYDFLGLDLALRYERVEVFGALGLGVLPGVGGVRYFAGDSGDGLVFSLHGGHLAHGPIVGGSGWLGTAFDYWTVSATAGYRFAWDHFFLEAGAGGGLLFLTPGSYVDKVIDLSAALGFEY